MKPELVTKIYLPKNAKEKFLYGHKTIETSQKQCDKSLKTVESYYILQCSSEVINTTSLDLIGTRSSSAQHSKGIHLQVDNLGGIEKIMKNGVEVSEEQQILVLYYEKARFLKSFDEVNNARTSSDNFTLVLAKLLKEEDERKNGRSMFIRVASKSNDFLIKTATMASKVLSVISPVFKNTVIHRHCCNWRQCLVDKSSKNGFFLLDVMLGIVFFLLMNHIQHTGRYFMDSTEFVVNKLRGLLQMLEGSPAGLKLNVQLNNFLLSCFMYHVDLWWNFIVIVEPAIHYLFLPITVFGLMGFSFQCAMLCDVITLITLHAHCFYIYAAMLYKLQLSSIRSLLRIVLGRRLNVLKNRVESQEYTNRQLFLATLFFTTLLFLLPTILIYYLVFASLRFSIYCISFILMSIQQGILTFPFYKYIRWITGSYIDASKISMKFIASRKFNDVHLLELDLSILSCNPWTNSDFVVKNEYKLTRPLSIDAFAMCLLRGEMMAFLPKAQM